MKELAGARRNGTAVDTAERPRRAGAPAPCAEAIRDWLIRRVAEAAEMDPSEVDPREPFVSYGLESAEAIGLSGDLQDWLGLRLPATLIYTYPTIESVTEYLTEQVRRL